MKSEAKVQTALVETGMKVPAICAWNEDLQAALHERMPGEADLSIADPEEQASVLDDFIEQLALLHSLDPDSLGLDHMPIPTTSAECALGEIDFVEQFLGGHGDRSAVHVFAPVDPQPRPRAPRPGEPLAGRHGAGQFHVPRRPGERHRGLGMGAFRRSHGGFRKHLHSEFFCPSTPDEGLGPVFRRYEELSGYSVHLDSVRYYRVQQFVRSIVSLARITVINDPQMPNGMNWAYRYICERATCEALADAMGVELERPELPQDEMGSSLEGVVIQNLRDEVLPSVDGDFPRHRLEHATLLVECLDRQKQLGPQLAAIELDEIADANRSTGRQPR